MGDLCIKDLDSHHVMKKPQVCKLLLGYASNSLLLTPGCSVRTPWEALDGWRDTLLVASAPGRVMNPFIKNPVGWGGGQHGRPSLTWEFKH